MKLKNVISMLVALTLICNFTMVVFAEVKDDSVAAPTYGDEAILNEMRARKLTDFEKNVDLKIPNRIFLSEEEAGTLPGVTTGFYYESINDLISPQSVGDGYVIGRARSWKTASGGYIRKGYKKGTFSVQLALMSDTPIDLRCQGKGGDLRSKYDPTLTGGKGNNGNGG